MTNRVAVDDLRSRDISMVPYVADLTWTVSCQACSRYIVSIASPLCLRKWQARYMHLAVAEARSADDLPLWSRDNDVMHATYFNTNPLSPKTNTLYHSYVFLSEEASILI